MFNLHVYFLASFRFSCSDYLGVLCNIRLWVKAHESTLEIFGGLCMIYILDVQVLDLEMIQMSYCGGCVVGSGWLQELRKKCVIYKRLFEFFQVRVIHFQRRLCRIFCKFSLKVDPAGFTSDSRMKFGVGPDRCCVGASDHYLYIHSHSCKRERCCPTARKKVKDYKGELGLTTL